MLDGVKASKVTGLNQFTKLKVLQLNGCGLTSLEEFPTLPIGGVSNNIYATGGTCGVR